MVQFRQRLTRLLVIPLAALACAGAAIAQVPNTLLYSLFDPGTNVQAGAGQGYSVAVDGNIAVVGVPFDDMGAMDSGVVKVYDATTGALLNTLTNPSPAAYDSFGISVAISGTRLVVGAYGNDTGATDAGSAYVYDLASAMPTAPVTTLTNRSPVRYGEFGVSVAISGTRVVVGAYGNGTGDARVGSAYVYDVASAMPTVPIATLNNPTSEFGDYFGISVAISGTRVVIGDPADNTGANDSGSAYVYDLTSATPAVPVVTLTNPSPALNDWFGYSVAIDGMRVVIGAFFDDTGATDAGSTYAYDLASVTPTVPVATLTNPSPAANDRFGWSVAISGTRVVIGAPQDNTGSTNAGSAYVYDLASATPTAPVATLTNPSPAAYDYFGRSVAVSGTRVVVGAYGDDSGTIDAGNTYLFDLASATPTAPVATLNNLSPALNDAFGISVAIYGTRVVIGAPQDDTGTTNAGSAYVYDLASAMPAVPVFVLTNPSPAAYDYFGRSVAVSGTRVVVGAYGDDTGAVNAGSAYVYELASATPTVPVATLNNPSPGAYGDEFGDAVAVSGTRVVVGAPFKNIGAAVPGSAYVYDIASATPTVPLIILTNRIPSSGDQFGSALAISGTRVVVGAPGDSSVMTNTGGAYVFDLASATPTVPVATLTNRSPVRYGEFGISMAISGTRVVVGAAYVKTGADSTGGAYVYDLTSTTPSLPVATLTNPSPRIVRHFGNAVAISGARVVVGAQYGGAGAADAGSAYVYDLASATPTVPVAVLNNPSPAVSEIFGSAVAIDGTTIVAGVPYDDSNAAYRGAAYIFGLAPTLRIVPAAPGFATISWTPTNAPGFVLQSTHSFAPTNWVNTPSGAANPITVPTMNASRFYRLFKP